MYVCTMFVPGAHKGQSSYQISYKWPLIEFRPSVRTASALYHCSIPSAHIFICFMCVHFSFSYSFIIYSNS